MGHMAMLSLPLIGVRAVHFASTVLIVGLVLFLVFIEAPALGQNRSNTWLAFHSQLLVIAWLSLATSIVSGAAWLLILVTRITGSSFVQVISDGSAQRVLTHTQFGHAWQIRLALA